MSKQFKIVVYVPEPDADKLRDAMGRAGAGIVGNYTFCTFSTKGIGRFKPMQGADPTIGEIGMLEEVQEEKIETVCAEEKLQEVLDAIRKAHPYEEPSTQVYELFVL